MKRLSISTMVVCVLVSLTVAGCSLLGVSRGPEKYDLKYELAEGSKFTLTVSGQDHYVREVMGNTATTDTKDTVEYGFEVISASKEGSTLELEYKNRIHETDDPQFQAGIDFSRIIGKKAKLDLSSRGEVSNFAGFEALPVIEIGDQETSMGESQYINEISRVFPKLPDNPISVGDIWSHTKEYDEPAQGGQIKFTVNLVYTLIGETKKDGIDCLEIDVKYTVNVEGKLTAGGIEFAIKLEGKGSELLYFAHKKGMLLYGEDSLVLEGSAENKDLGISVSMKHDYKTRTDAALD